MKKPLMASRFTQTEKWDDKWFRQLSPNAKVLYWYIWDKCDIAGFWEVDLEGAVFHTKIAEGSIRGAFEELMRGFDEAGGWIWIRKFCYHQNNLPLNPENNAHKGVLKRILVQRDRFPHVLETLKKQLFEEKNKGANVGLDSPTSKSKGKSISISKGKSKGNEKKIQLFPIKGRTCREHGCGMPAVYKIPGGYSDFGEFVCSGHMPAKVKEKYA